ncbi:MAG TPA: hypothetical protein PKD37_06885 [Oligoflexia bacterium]|nr:hypothetical protein [Oligoflexia bacterium]
MKLEEKNTAIFSVFEDFVPHDPAAPERELLRALLMSAIYDLKKKGRISKMATQFFLNPEEDHIFSFQSICNMLEIDPKRILIVVGLQDADNLLKAKKRG